MNGLHIVSSGNQASGYDASLYIGGNNDDWGITIGAASGKTEYGMQIQMPSSFNYALRILKNGSEHFNVNSTDTIDGGPVVEFTIVNPNQIVFQSANNTNGNFSVG